MGAPTRGASARGAGCPPTDSLFSLKQLEGYGWPLSLWCVLCCPEGGEMWSACSHFGTLSVLSVFVSLCKRVLQPHSHVLRSLSGVLFSNSYYLSLWGRVKSGTTYFTMLVMSLPLIFLVTSWEVKKFLTLIRCNLSNFLYIIRAFCALCKKFFAHLRQIKYEQILWLSLDQQTEPRFPPLESARDILLLGQYSVAEATLGSGLKGLAAPNSCLFEYCLLKSMF